MNWPKLSRNATRRGCFSATSGPRDVLDEALALAMRAPSNSNIRPWRLFLATGPRRDRLVEALLERASTGYPATVGLPERFARLRGRSVRWCTDRWALPRRHRGASHRTVAQLGVLPCTVAGVVCMHRDLGHADSLAVGMFLQTLVLALTERGAGIVPAGVDRALPDVLREQLDIPDRSADHLRPLRGLRRSGISGQSAADTSKPGRGERGLPGQLSSTRRLEVVCSC